MNRQSQQPSKVMKSSSSVIQGGGLSVVSPLKTVSKRAQRKSMDQQDLLLTTPGSPVMDMDVKNGGNKKNKGKRGHKITSSMEDIDYRLDSEILAEEQDHAIERINGAIADYSLRVQEINQRSKSRPVSAHIDADGKKLSSLFLGIISNTL
jgi:hypothetical protein